MKNPHRTLIVSALVFAGLVSTSTPSPAPPVTFVVDPAESSLSLTADWTLPLVGTVTVQEQAPGSLTTSYGGTIKADVTSTSIEFTGGSSIVASNSGIWQPGLGGGVGSAPANYGGQGTVSLATALVAMRDIVSDALSGSISIIGTNFSANSIVFGFDTNANSVLDYSYNLGIGGSGSGSYPLTGLSTNDIGLLGSLATVGDEQVLTIPVNYTGKGWLLSADDLEYTLTGTLVARAGAAAELPEVLSLQVNPDQLVLEISTTDGEDYTVLGGSTPTTISTSLDNFTASGSTTTRTINKTLLSEEFLRVRLD
jgi:hypothetical protein